ncbi:MAG TPA: hypothetical protein PLS81_10110 [Deltaproteobacteria bacterium]|nr:hypothetical protein [Deltaproteobacteria bacterium]HOM29794.1 hypothetical protein [Deltaproteobacteria bacterium]HPP80186.1 hypothetical protein [Deltaproteobacteria bacterium]
MGYLLPEHSSALRYGSLLAEQVLSRSLGWHAGDLYDVTTVSEIDSSARPANRFAQLLRVEVALPHMPHHYRVCLLDDEILSFLEEHLDIDLVSLITFIMTHELLHVHRFSTGKADFFGDPVSEEVVVDALTRVILAKYPVIGLKRVLSLLDRLKAAPLYNGHIMNEPRCVDAYL